MSRNDMEEGVFGSIWEYLDIYGEEIFYGQSGKKQ
jgi:hypothetical protein